MCPDEPPVEVCESKDHLFLPDGLWGWQVFDCWYAVQFHGNTIYANGKSEKADIWDSKTALFGFAVEGKLS